MQVFASHADSIGIFIQQNWTSSFTRCVCHWKLLFVKLRLNVLVIINNFWFWWFFSHLGEITQPDCSWTRENSFREGSSHRENAEWNFFYERKSQTKGRGGILWFFLGLPFSAQTWLQNFDEKSV